ncbi:CYTH domain-containing protein [Pseudooceanicola sp. LIPI14-2-Ac024]|uniref:CYTH domain-containing protein n=1 Tax=Pseudooceanicola sp. LIPI14-2-Ac024 TaxID=3344875 RepID=UPI0035D05EA0
MAQEIERKFLVANEGWRPYVIRSERLRDGLIATDEGRKVRVRFYDGQATICVKGRRNGLERDEYEYPIPAADAHEMLDRHCNGDVVEKVRYHVPAQGLTWTVDVYDGLLSGIVIAEVELPARDTAFPRPHWLGPEVTGQQAYRKINMVAARKQALAAQACS